MTKPLRQKKCVPCEIGTPPMPAAEAEKLLTEIYGDWKIMDGKKLKRNFRFDDFVQAMAFVNRVAGIAEREGHHPDIHLFYNKLTLEFWTHASGGLTENDFILAAKLDELS
jgi:4a-hydroxytetrahydrobiopterin dehydratase